MHSNCSVTLCLWKGTSTGRKALAESLSLENRGFGFEEADFEVHFSEKGTDYGILLEIVKKHSKVFCTAERGIWFVFSNCRLKNDLILVYIVYQLN